MSFSVTVRRGNGLYPGDDIIDPLVVELSVGLARGRNELDDRAHALQDVEVTIPFRVGLRLGQVVKVIETVFGTTWYGKITGLTHTYEDAALVSNISIRRPSEFGV